MESLTNFVIRAKSGALLINSGGMSGNKIAEGYGILGADDITALTAEAYNQDVISIDIAWADGVQMVRDALRQVSANMGKR